MNLTKPPILLLALPKHDDAYTSTPYQLAKEFAKDREVWYLSHPFTWVDFLKNIRNKKIWKRCKANWSNRIITEPTSLNQLNLLYLPLILPINGLPPGKLYDFFSDINHYLVARTIQKLLRERKIKEYVLVNSHDFYLGRLIDWLPAPLLNIYHCIDPIIKTYSARHGNYLEKEAAQAADLVIATAPFLQQKMQGYNAKSYCVPNAANYNLSYQATLPVTKIHPSVEKIEGVKIGYIGNIERRIHYGWLTEIFSGRKDWQLVLVGPKDQQYIPETFMQLPNVHFISPVPHEQLPNVLKGFDVAIIPFKKDEVSAQIYPLKLFEYMGSGKPVVTTDFNPEVLQPFRDDIYLGTTVAELEAAIEDALSEEGNVCMQRRLQLAAQNDWVTRGKQFLELIDEHTYAHTH